MHIDDEQMIAGAPLSSSSARHSENSILHTEFPEVHSSSVTFVTREYGIARVGCDALGLAQWFIGRASKSGNVDQCWWFYSCGVVGSDPGHVAPASLYQPWPSPAIPSQPRSTSDENHIDSHIFLLYLTIFHFRIVVNSHFYNLHAEIIVVPGHNYNLYQVHSGGIHFYIFAYNEIHCIQFAFDSNKVDCSSQFEYQTIIQNEIFTIYA